MIKDSVVFSGTICAADPCHDLPFSYTVSQREASTCRGFLQDGSQTGQAERDRAAEYNRAVIAQVHLFPTVSRVMLSHIRPKE